MREPPAGQPLGRVDEQCLHGRLAVGGVRADVRQVGPVPLDGRHREVRLGVDVAVQRGDPPGVQLRLQSSQRLPAGVAEDDVEPAEPLDGQVRHVLAGRHAGQGHAGVQVVERLAVDVAGQDQLARRPAVRAVAGDHAHVGVGQLVGGRAADGVPVGVQDQPAAGQLGHVAVLGVVRHVPLEERDRVPPRHQRPPQPPPERGVAVAPAGADGQPEDDELHARPPPPWSCGRRLASRRSPSPRSPAGGRSPPPARSGPGPRPGPARRR